MSFVGADVTFFPLIDIFQYPDEEASQAAQSGGEEEGRREGQIVAKRGGAMCVMCWLG